MSDILILRDWPSTQVHHTETVRLSALGSASRWMAALGDWSWDYVSGQCGVDVTSGRNEDGQPSYLAFCYVRMLAGSAFPRNAISPGNELDVTTSGFRGSSDSLSVIHQIRHKSNPAAPRLGTYEQLREGDEHSLIFEGFNRWLARSRDDDNSDLTRSEPVGFSSEHLPPIPDAYHPRRRYRPAIERLSFHDGGEWQPAGDEVVRPYQVDGSRDINGFGLFYFASYFDLFQIGAREAALRGDWCEADFRRRAVSEHEAVFVRNANLGETLEIVSRARRSRVKGAYLFDVAVRRASGELLAVATEICDLASDHERASSPARVVAIDARAPVPAEAPNGRIGSLPEVERFLHELIGDTAGNAIAPLPVDRSFEELGWDSLTLLDVVARLEGVFGPLRQDLAFRRTSIAGLAAYLIEHREARVREALADGGLAAVPTVSAPAERFEPFPLTAIQRAYVAGRSDAFALGGKGCHLYWEFESEGWDIERLEQAWRTLVRRHDMLRLSASPDGSQHVRSAGPDFHFQTHDLRGSDAVGIDNALAAIREQVSHHDFDVAEGPMFRIEVSLLPHSMRLHFAIDMLAVDGPSLFLLLHQWSALYHDPAFEIPLASMSFRDAVLHRERLRSSEEWRRARAYWQGRELPPAPEPFAAAEIERIRNPHFRRIDGRLEAAVWSRLQQSARTAGITPSAALLSAFAESLRLWLRRP